MRNELTVDIALDACELLNDGLRPPDPREVRKQEEEDPEAAEDAEQMFNEEDTHYMVRDDYSGRAMYGSKVVAIITYDRYDNGLKIGAAIAMAVIKRYLVGMKEENPDEEAVIDESYLMDLWDDVQAAMPQRSDSMGLGSIYY